jgi:hypothetical protein
MHSTASCCGYSLGLNPGGSDAGPWRRQRAAARAFSLSTPPTDDVTSVNGPGSLSRGVRCRPPGPVCQRGLVSTSITAPGRRCGRARCHPPRLLGGLGSNGGMLPLRRAGGLCATGSLLGVSWAARWCDGSPEHVSSVKPAASRQGSRSRCELQGPPLPRGDRQRGRLGRSSQPRPAPHAATRIRDPGVGYQSQSSARSAASTGRGPVGCGDSRSGTRVHHSRVSSCAGRRDGQRYAGSSALQPCPLGVCISSTSRCSDGAGPPLHRLGCSGPGRTPRAERSQLGCRSARHSHRSRLSCCTSYAKLEVLACGWGPRVSPAQTLHKV